jgi:integrase
MSKTEESDNRLTVAQFKKKENGKYITDKHIKNTIALCDGKKHQIEDNLYLHILKSGKATWLIRYSFNGVRKQLKLGSYDKPPRGLTLKLARDTAAKKVLLLTEGIDPKQQIKDNIKQSVFTVKVLAEQWLKWKSPRIDNPQIPERILKNDILPIIGTNSVKDIQSGDILDLVEGIFQSGRPTIANDALGYCKQLFRYAVKKNHIKFNPALAISQEDAGGKEKHRTRNLIFDEIKTVLQILRDNKDQFTRENYIAVCLLIALGVRKCELIAAPWCEFDLDNQIWMLPKERTKKDAPAINIPLPDQVMPFLKELKIRACESDYLFPARRASKRRGYISDDTLNHALGTLFGTPSHYQKNKGISPPNLMSEAGIQHFVIHDLRRTCRTRLSELDVQFEVKEICLNHVLKGLVVVYDGWQYFEKRKEALTLLAKKLEQYW